jgi:hypothetical protein
MHALLFLLFALIAAALFPLWALLHELAHVAAAAWAAPIKSWGITLLPQREPDGSLRWAKANWVWADVPTMPRFSFVYLAPRVPDLLAAFALPLGPLLLPAPWPRLAWALVFGAGLVDLAVGSVGSSPSSDLQLAACAGKWSPWWGRVLGFAAVAISASVWLALSLLR